MKLRLEFVWGVESVGLGKKEGQEQLLSQGKQPSINNANYVRFS